MCFVSGGVLVLELLDGGFCCFELGFERVVLVEHVLEATWEVLEADGLGLRVTFGRLGHQFGVFVLENTQIVKEFSVSSVGLLELLFEGENFRGSAC